MNPIASFFQKPFISYEFSAPLAEEPFAFCQGSHTGIATEKELFCHVGPLNDKGLVLEGSYHFLHAEPNQWYFTDKTRKALYVSDFTMNKNVIYPVAKRILACTAHKGDPVIVTERTITRIKKQDGSFHLQPLVQAHEILNAHATGTQILFHTARAYFLFNLETNKATALSPRHAYIGQGDVFLSIGDRKVKRINGATNWEIDLSYASIHIQAVTDRYLALLVDTFGKSSILILDKMTGATKLEVKDVYQARVFQDSAVLLTSKPSLLAYDINSQSLIHERPIDNCSDFFYGHGKLMVVEDEARLGVIE